MSIDLFTLVAQVINLIILLFLLRKFLYLPVLKAVDERQKFIASELNKASSAHRQAQELERICQQKIMEIDVQKQEILGKTQAEAQALSEKLSAEAKAEFVQAKKNWQKRLQTEQKTFDLAIQNLIVEHFRTFATDALKQMADVNLNDLIADKLKEKILALSAVKKEQFAQAYQNKKLIVVQSAKKMTTDNQKNLKKFLMEQFALNDDIKFNFMVNNELVCGIAIQAEEQLIAWNLAGYLEEFQKNMDNEVSQLINRG